MRLGGSRSRPDRLSTVIRLARTRRAQISVGPRAEDLNRIFFVQLERVDH
jgi:hypothetical protein